MIEISKIRIDGGTQARAELHQETVAEYAEAYKSGASMPAITVFYDGSNYWLADGFHRFFGAKSAGLVEIYEEIIPGTLEDAILASLGANSKHGLRRTNADKRRAVMTMLEHSVWATWSDVSIAKTCGVSSMFVGDMRKSIIKPFNDSKPETRTVERNGKTYEQNVANIGKKPEAPTPAPAPQQTATVHPIQPEHDEAAMQAEMMQDAIEALRAENDSLSNQLASMLFTGTDEEKAALLDRLNTLTKENEQLQIMNRGLIIARDRVMTENASMRKQLTLNAKKLKAVA